MIRCGDLLGANVFVHCYESITVQSSSDYHLCWREDFAIDYQKSFLEEVKPWLMLRYHKCFFQELHPG